MKPQLTGELTHAGDLTVNGEEMTGCAVLIGRGTLRAMEEIPMYEQCVILTWAEYQKLVGEVEV